MNTNDVPILLLNKDSIVCHELVGDKVVELMRNISENKILKKPISCIKVNNKYLILDGHHRYTALCNLGYDLIPVRLYQNSDIDLNYWYHIIGEREYAQIITYVNKMKYIKFGSSREKAIISMGHNNIMYDICASQEDLFTVIESVFKIYKHTDIELASNQCKDKPWICYNGVNFQSIVDLAIQNKLLPYSITRFIGIDRDSEFNIKLNSHSYANFRV